MNSSSPHPILSTVLRITTWLTIFSLSVSGLVGLIFFGIQDPLTLLVTVPLFLIFLTLVLLAMDSIFNQS